MLGLGLRSVVKCLTPMHESPGSVFNTDWGGGGVREEGREGEREKKTNWFKLNVTASEHSQIQI